MAGEEGGKTTGVGLSSGEAGPCLPGGAARQNIYEETVRAAEGVQKTIPPDKVGPLCLVRHPMVVDLHRGVEWCEHHSRGWQYLTRRTCVDRCIRPVWLWGSGSGDRGLVAATVARVLQPGAPSAQPGEHHTEGAPASGASLCSLGEILA